MIESLEACLSARQQHTARIFKTRRLVGYHQYCCNLTKAISPGTAL